MTTLSITSLGIITFSTTIEKLDPEQNGFQENSIQHTSAQHNRTQQTALSITSLSIMAFSITKKHDTEHAILSINNTQYK
jgi:hypothetical protein